MCTYTFTLDDKLVDRISSQFKGKEAMQLWLQQELEQLVIRRAAKNGRISNLQGKKSARKQILELAAGKRQATWTDLKGILEGATRGAEDMRNDYLTEKYGL